MYRHDARLSCLHQGLVAVRVSRKYGLELITKMLIELILAWIAALILSNP
jgi:hypothetical protein